MEVCRITAAGVPAARVYLTWTSDQRSSFWPGHTQAYSEVTVRCSVTTPLSCPECLCGCTKKQVSEPSDIAPLAILG